MNASSSLKDLGTRGDMFDMVANTRYTIHITNDDDGVGFYVDGVRCYTLSSANNTEDAYAGIWMSNSQIRVFAVRYKQL